mgnify:CR=1 FL=1
MKAACLIALTGVFVTFGRAAPALANSPRGCVTLASVCAPQPDALLLCRPEADKSVVVVEVRKVTDNGPAPAVGSKLASVHLSTPARNSSGCQQAAASSCTGVMVVYAWWASGLEMRRVGTISGSRFAPWDAPSWCAALDAEQALQALALPVFSCEDRMNELAPAPSIGSGCGAGTAGSRGTLALAAAALAMLALLGRRGHWL